MRRQWGSNLRQMPVKSEAFGNSKLHERKPLDGVVSTPRRTAATEGGPAGTWRSIEWEKGR